MTSPPPVPPSPFPAYDRPELTWIDWLADHALIGAGVVTLLFCIVYATVFRWYSTAAGRAVLWAFTSLVLVLTLNTFARISGGDYPFRDLLRLGVYVNALAAAGYLLVTLLLNLRRGGPALPLDERQRKHPTGGNPIMADQPAAEPTGEAYAQQDERVLNTTEIARTADGGTLVATNVGVPTQVANPIRATVRTVAAVLSGLVFALPIVNGVLAAIQAELLASGLDLPGWVWLAVNGSIAAVALVSGIVTRILAIPGVNDWLAQHAATRGLTAVPVKPIAEADPDMHAIV